MAEKVNLEGLYKELESLEKAMKEKPKKKIEDVEEEKDEELDEKDEDEDTKDDEEDTKDDEEDKEDEDLEKAEVIDVSRDVVEIHEMLKAIKDTLPLISTEIADLKKSIVIHEPVKTPDYGQMLTIMKAQHENLMEINKRMEILESTPATSRNSINSILPANEPLIPGTARMELNKAITTGVFVNKAYELNEINNLLNSGKEKEVLDLIEKYKGVK